MKIYKLKEPVTGYKAGTLVTPVSDWDSNMPTCMTVKIISHEVHKKDYIYPQWSVMEEYCQL